LLAFIVYCLFIVIVWIMSESRSSALQRELQKELLDRLDRQSEQISGLRDLLAKTLRENAELRQRITQLENNQSAFQTAPAPVVAPPAELPYTSVPCVDDLNPVPDAAHDILILSDSICRHVGSSQPKHNNEPAALYQEITLADKISCLKVVIPGARAPRLLSEAAHIATKYSFREVIVQCGANYVPDTSKPWRRVLQGHARRAFDEVSHLLGSLRNVFSDSNIVFSPILPQRNAPPGCINSINDHMYEFCDMQRFDRLYPAAFDDRQATSKYIARDGVHLNESGVAELTSAINVHIYHTLKY
jgi:hypothetical protein